MNFTYSAIGDNTPENREHLEKLGYEPWLWDEEDNSVPYISTMPDTHEYASFEKDDLNEWCFKKDINCIGNGPLFRAVTAMRTDSDYMQWFVFDKKSFVGDTLIGFKGEWLIVKDHNILFDKRTYVHKATLSELQEHFKTTSCESE